MANISPTVKLYVNTLAHLGLVVVLHDGYRLTSVDPVLVNGVAIEVPHGSNSISLTPDIDLVTLHHLLDGCTDITQPDIDARLPDTRIGGILSSLQQLIIDGIEGDREGAIYDPPIDVRPEVNLADLLVYVIDTYIIILDGGVVARIGCVMSRHIIQGAPGGERYTGIQAALLHQVSVHVLQPLTHIDQSDPQYYDIYFYPGRMMVYAYLRT